MMSLFVKYVIVEIIRSITSLCFVKAVVPEFIKNATEFLSYQIMTGFALYVKYLE